MWVLVLVVVSLFSILSFVRCWCCMCGFLFILRVNMFLMLICLLCWFVMEVLLLVFLWRMGFLLGLYMVLLDGRGVGRCFIICRLLWLMCCIKDVGLGGFLSRCSVVWCCVGGSGVCVGFLICFLFVMCILI